MVLTNGNHFALQSIIVMFIVDDKWGVRRVGLDTAAGGSVAGYCPTRLLHNNFFGAGGWWITASTVGIQSIEGGTKLDYCSSLTLIYLYFET